MESNEGQSIQERFTKAFEQVGLSQAAIGDILGVSQRTISNYLSGKSEPSENYIRILEEYDAEDVQKSGTLRIKQLEGLLWKIGNDHPRSREIVQQMLQLKDKIKELLD